MSHKAMEKIQSESGASHLTYLILKKTGLCYPTSIILSGKQMCALLVLSSAVWIATASPTVHSRTVNVSVALDELVRAQRGAAETCPESRPDSWCWPVRRGWSPPPPQCLGKSH